MSVYLLLISPLSRNKSDLVSISSFSCVQLSGWTSNLVDIVMAHHFSTVSLTYCYVVLLTFSH